MNFDTILLEDFEAFADQSLVRVIKKKVPKVKSPKADHTCPICNRKYCDANYLKWHIKSKCFFVCFQFTTSYVCNKFAGIDLGTYFDLRSFLPQKKYRLQK